MKKSFLILLSIILVSGFIKAQTIWTIGPMLHVNFGEGKTRCSYSLETAYWNFSGFPWSVDFAMEFEKKKIRIYSEGQTGFGLGGIAAGPVLEFNKENNKTSLGWQASIWGNYYWGFDLRYRKINGNKFFCPGTYLKVGFNSRDENGDPIKSSSMSDWDD